MSKELEMVKYNQGEVVEVTKGKSEDVKTSKVLNVTVDESAYVDSLPEDITMDIVKKVSVHNAKYLEDLATNSLAISDKMFKENKGVDTIKVTAPYLGDAITSRSSRVEVSIDKEESRYNPATKEVSTGPSFGMKVVNKSEKLGSTFLSALKKDMHARIG